MAISSGYDYSVRKGLNDKGIDNSRISFNPNTQSVSVDGRDFMKGNKIYNGTSYTNQQGFNSAWDAYNKPQPNTYGGMGAFGIGAGGNGIRTGAGGAGIGSTTAQGIPSYQPPKEQAQPQQQPQTNTYTPQIDSLIATLMQQAQSQQQVDPYSTPEYAAYAAQSARRANEGIRAAQEALGSAGFGRSTALGERAQGIQNQENEYLNTQVIPQLIAAEQARRQQQFGNLSSLLNPLIGQQGFVSSEDQRAIVNRLNEKNANLNAALQVGNATGKLINPQDEYSGLFRQAANPNTPLNMAGQNQQLNTTQTMASLTGMMPDGKGGFTPTTAEQQRQLGNLWTVAEQTGTIPDELANLYGLPKGTQTQAAKQFAQNLGLQQDQNSLAADKFQYDQLKDQAAAESGTKATPAQVKQILQNYQLTGQDSEGKAYKYIPGPGKPARKDWVKSTVQSMVNSGYDNSTIEQVLRSAGISSEEEDSIYGGK